MYSTSGALLEACVLGCLSRGPTYGYALTQRVKTALGVSESTLYPVLRRLQKDGLLTTRDEAYDGRNRRYYDMTNVGRERLHALTDAWIGYRGVIDGMISGRDEE